MLQILQSLSTGKASPTEVPACAAGRGQILILSKATLVSAGTERMLVEFGKAGWIEKARQQPDKVRMVLEKVKRDGFVPTLEAVRSKLDQPLAMGYCNVGTVLEVGAGVSGFAVGDRVASNGKHAEVVCVPQNLCAKIPINVSDEAAAFTVLGAIALQGIRLAAPTLGESVVVTGLGLIGLLTVQLLEAQGCRVMGIDPDPAKCELGRQFGADVVDLSKGQDPVTVADAFSRGRGVDAVLITAATKSNEPMHQAALMCRKRGRIVLVGVTGLELSRADFYEKELTFQVSCSYGPGRYDPLYEEKGQDYPIGFVRWTARRNFEAVLDMMAEGRIDVQPLISHRFPLERAPEAYRILSEESPLGILLEYPKSKDRPDLDLLSRTVRLAPSRSHSPGVPVLGFIGSGNYATNVLIPAFKQAGVRAKTVVSNVGVSAVHAGRKYGFEEAATDAEAVIQDAGINAVVIATRHDSHARYVCSALEAGKHVFVEKPLCLTTEETTRIESLYTSLQDANPSPPILMVGFNRRFAPQVRKIKSLLDGVPGPKSFVMTVNAGAIPAEHWTQDLEAGGGRIIGEACHFIDLLRFLAGAPIESHSAMGMAKATRDTMTISLRFADGSVGAIHYFANGSKSFPKERLEVFAAGRVLQLDNFRGLKGFGWPGFRKMNLWRQDKGQKACAAAFTKAIREGKPSPIPFDEVIEVNRITIRIADDLRQS